MEIGDPAFNRVTDGAVTLEGTGQTLTQRAAVVSVVEGAVRAVVKR